MLELNDLIEKSSWFGSECGKVIRIGKRFRMNIGENEKIIMVVNKFTNVVHCLIISNNLNKTVEKFKWLLNQIK